MRKSDGVRKIVHVELGWQDKGFRMEWAMRRRVLEIYWNSLAIM